MLSNYIFLAILTSLINQLISTPTTFTGWFPPNCYAVAANTGDVLSGTISWSKSSTDMDLYLFAPGPGINFNSYAKCTCSPPGIIVQTTSKTASFAGNWVYCVDQSSGPADRYTISVYKNSVVQYTMSNILLDSHSQFLSYSVTALPCLLFITFNSSQSYKVSLYTPGTLLVSGPLGTMNYNGGSGTQDICFNATAIGSYDLRIIGNPETPSTGSWGYYQFWGSFDCGTCSSFMVQCTQCTSSKVCTACDPGYCVNVLNTNTCQSCGTAITSCLSCTSAAVCTLCDNTHLVSATFKCQLCGASLTNCLTCAPTPTKKCLTCAVGYYVDIITSNCLACNTVVSGCINCASASVCIQCVVMYYVKSPSFCELCNATLAECTNCSIDGLICYNCANISFLIVSGVCSNCSDVITGCLTCSSKVTCLTCQSTYHKQPRILTGDVYCKLCLLSMTGCNTCSSATFCLSVINNKYILYMNRSVDLCGIPIKSCLTCNSPTNCLSCATGFFLSGGKCLVCSSIIKYCDLCHVSTFCDICQAGFIPSPSGNCTCLHNWYVPSTCTGVYGCLYAQKLNSTTICLLCDTFQHFFYNSSTHLCDCALGYALQNHTCVEYCGDGIHFVEICDDGNQKEGDGCDMNCQVESGYQCVGTSYQVSKCFLDVQVKIKYLYTVRVDGENKGKCYFGITPYNAQFQTYDFSRYIRTSNPQISSNLTAFYFGDRIEVDFEYNKSCEQTQLKFTFDMSQKIYLSQAISLSVSTFSMYPPLSILTQTSFFSIVFLWGQVLSYLILITFFISLIFHKMIGLELLLVFQLLYCMGQMGGQMTQVTRVITALSPIMAITQITEGSRLSQVQPQTIRYFVDGKALLYGLNIPYAIFIGVLIVFVLLKIILTKKNFKLKQFTRLGEQMQKNVFMKSKAKQQKLKTQMQQQKFVIRDVIFHTNNKKQFVYQRLLYPISIFLLNPLLIFLTISLIGSNTGQSPTITVISHFMLLFALIVILVVVVGQVRNFTTQYKENQLKVQFRKLTDCLRKEAVYKYQTLFLVHNIVCLLLSLIGFNLGQPFLPTILIMVVTFLYLLCIKFMSPYLNPIHSTILIVSYSVIFIQSGCILFNRVGSMSQITYLTLILCMFIFGYVCIILTLYRLFIDYSTSSSKSLSVQVGPTLNIKKISDTYQFNKFLQKNNSRYQISGYIQHFIPTIKETFQQGQHGDNKDQNQENKLEYVRKRLRKEITYIKGEQVYYGDQRLRQKI